MKAGTKYTAQQVIDALGVEQFTVGEVVYPKDQVFGQLRVRIGGVTGIVDSNHRVNVQAGTEKLEVVIGNEIYELQFEPAE